MSKCIIEKDFSKDVSHKIKKTSPSCKDFSGDHFALQTISVLGVSITNTTMKNALKIIERILNQSKQKSHSIFFVNTNTLNLSCDTPKYKEILNSADYLFADGTGVRLAIGIQHHTKIKDNINGTDLVPLLFTEFANKGLRYFLLGNTPTRIEQAAAYAKKNFTGWTLAGYHHGYLENINSDSLIKMINDSGADVLLVGMGNPLQEQWIHSNISRLKIPLCFAVGGLFDYWVGDLTRAKQWIRKIGCEWVHILLSQPHKKRRYLIGNPKFIARVLHTKFSKSKEKNEKPTLEISTSRWIIKKVTRKMMVLGSLFSGSLLIRKLIKQGPSIRILTYHRISDEKKDPWSVSPKDFELQMQWLKKHNLAVSLEEVIKFVQGEINLPEGSVLVTFDDGYSSVLHEAAPILKSYGIPSVAFITTSFINSISVSGEPYLTWDEVLNLSHAGITVGSHAHTHRSLAKLDYADFYQEVSYSKELLEEHLGSSVCSFAYPYGMKQDENADTGIILQECGYSSIFIAQHGTISSMADLSRLPRVKVEGHDPLWLFKLLCGGGMDLWKLIDNSLWVFQKPSLAEEELSASIINQKSENIRAQSKK